MIYPAGAQTIMFQKHCMLGYEIKRVISASVPLFTCMHCTRICSLVLNEQEILSMENHVCSKWAHEVNVF